LPIADALLFKEAFARAVPTHDYENGWTLNRDFNGALTVRRTLPGVAKRHLCAAQHCGA
jgi:hypothetical protein